MAVVLQCTEFLRVLRLQGQCQGTKEIRLMGPKLKLQGRTNQLLLEAHLPVDRSSLHHRCRTLSHHLNHQLARLIRRLRINNRWVVIVEDRKRLHRRLLPDKLLLTRDLRFRDNLEDRAYHHNKPRCRSRIKVIRRNVVLISSMDIILVIHRQTNPTKANQDIHRMALRILLRAIHLMLPNPTITAECLQRLPDRVLHKDLHTPVLDLPKDLKVDRNREAINKGLLTLQHHNRKCMAHPDSILHNLQEDPRCLMHIQDMAARILQMPMVSHLPDIHQQAVNQAILHHNNSILPATHQVNPFHMVRQRRQFQLVLRVNQLLQPVLHQLSQAALLLTLTSPVQHPVKRLHPVQAQMLHQQAFRTPRCLQRLPPDMHRQLPELLGQYPHKLTHLLQPLLDIPRRVAIHNRKLHLVSSRRVRRSPTELHHHQLSISSHPAVIPRPLPEDPKDKDRRPVRHRILHMATTSKPILRFRRHRASISRRPKATNTSARPVVKCLRQDRRDLHRKEPTDTATDNRPSKVASDRRSARESQIDNREAGLFSTPLSTRAHTTNNKARALATGTRMKLDLIFSEVSVVKRLFL